MQSPQSRSSVFSSYFILILRNFYKNRFYTFLNLIGLSIGFTAFLYTLIYVHFETNFENFHTKSAQIYRVTHQYDPGEGFKVHWARISFDYINELPNDIPGVKNLIRFQNQERKYIRIGQEKFRPDHAYVTDKEVFEVFGFNLIAGNPATALAEPHSIVITKSFAKKYFGDQVPINKEIFVIGDFDKTETSHRITGVMEDVPSNTHLPVNMLISFKDKNERSGWAYTYILLQDKTKIEEIEARIPEFVRKYEDPDAAKRLSIFFQPLQDIHLHSNLAREIVPNGKIFYVKIVAFAGIFILIIALINFMNLNSAMALGRAKEIGMRKIMGASKRQLAAYLFIESITNNMLALCMGSLIGYLSFPLLQRIVPLQVLLDFGWLAIIMIVIAIVCGLASGLYPVLLLVSLKPMDTVRSSKTFSFVKKESPFNLKRVMVTLQFCISIIFVGSAIVAYNQFRYLNEKNLGMNRDQIIAIPGVPDKVKDNFLTFKNTLSTYPGIMGVAACMEVPSREIRDSGPVLIEGVNDDPTKAPIVDVQIIDHEFAELLGLEFLAGGNIPQSLGTGTVPEFTEELTIQKYLFDQRRAYIINETAMRQLGWKSPEEAIGQKINWSIGDMQLAHGPIAGVVRDFHQETLKNKVDPIVMVYEPVWLRTFLIKVETENIQESIEKIRATWDKMFPLYPMEYYFLDDLYENLYKGERVQLQLLYIFSSLAIVIAFIGLVGLIAYALKTRVKEIAIRKVMGASISDLVRLISKEYLAILLVGGALAIPISIYALNQWLSSFAYRVDISPISYVVTLSVISVLLILIIGLQTLRGTLINPAETLRDE